jgi:AcrR family transcriptional regulator
MRLDTRQSGLYDPNRPVFLERLAAMRLKPRERILSVADQLFYGRGLRAVGVEEIVARSETAKASLYAHFPTKDALIAGYLQRRSDDWRAHLESQLERRGGSPVARLDSVFAVLAEGCATPGFRGCPFINAAVEFPDPAHPARVIGSRHRAWVRTLLLNLARQAEMQDPDGLADQLSLLYDSAMVGTQLSGTASAAITAWGAARVLVKAAVRGRRSRARRTRPKSGARQTPRRH